MKPPRVGVTSPARPEAECEPWLVFSEGRWLLVVGVRSIAFLTPETMAYLRGDGPVELVPKA